MATRARTAGGNLAFASILAALSYLPFEIIAKSTLIFCIAIFILDPFPTSRLVSVGGVMVVLILTRVKKRFADSEAQDVPQEQNDKDKSD
jgi:hypothetical protein